VDTGGGPERDDYGLPPVDVEIPDDARELDEDVQAYRRELRAVRRQQRANRLRRPLGRDGMALPLLAACLMLALITSTLLVLFAADETGMPQVSSPSASAGARSTAGRAGQPLPTALVVIGDRIVSARSLADGRAALLALVPRGCDCAPQLRQLAAQAGPAHVALYLIGSAGGITQLKQLAAQSGAGAGAVGEDSNDVLGTVYREAGLTAVLVRSGGTVAYVGHGLSDPQAMTALDDATRQLSRAATGR
jgi:hypothetical protein